MSAKTVFTGLFGAGSIGAYLVYQFILPVTTDIAKDSLKRAITPQTTAIVSNHLKGTGLFSDEQIGQIADNVNADAANRTIQIECKRHENAEQCVARNQSAVVQMVGLDKIEAEMMEFNQVFFQCKDEIAQNSEIDLSDDVAKYDATVQCLIVNNQGKVLDTLAQTDEELHRTIKEIKTKLEKL